MRERHEIILPSLKAAAPLRRPSKPIKGRWMMSDPHSRQPSCAVAAGSLLTVAGGAMDAWVYLAHGHVFANAQSGNVVLMAVSLARGDGSGAANHLPSLLAFVTGLLISRLSGDALKRAKLNSRDIRLG